MTSITSSGWAAALRPGTVLSFRFPLGEGEGRAKARPCLVIGVASQDDEAPRVTIAYGTSATSHANRGLDLHLPEPNDWQAPGCGARAVSSCRAG
ncbi:hypothetical protein RAH32_09035 [Paracoccus sp. WLY502]|uniref:hypothetical protein n=1 Tax=Paracoccus yibinensis TaxID=3068891 RepID=UPI002796DFCC|nr:hypothetical protein [Paracoccus sp. WLY502]MDQ1900588.1 hypothetical protein [Paracoccus sp. WLY502]